MEAIIRNVRDINANERQVLERVLGKPLQEDQQVIEQILTLKNGATEKQPSEAVRGQLPDWCDVYAGLTDEQVADVEGVILQRADMSRTSE